MYVYHNSKLCKMEQAKVSVTNQSFLFGYGLFETIKVNAHSTIYFDEHYNRLKNSCSILNMELCYIKQAIEQQCSELIIKNDMHIGAIKIVYSKAENGYDMLITTRDFSYPKELYDNGARVILSEIRRNEYSPYVRVKSTNYLENLIVREATIKMGFNEAIFLNTSGNVAEGTVSNIFWLKSNILYTPDINCGLLPGVMRQKLIEAATSKGMEVHEGAFAIEALMNADHIYLTNSLMEVMPVSEIVFGNNFKKNYSISPLFDFS